MLLEARTVDRVGWPAVIGPFSGGGGADAVRAERIEHGQVPELRGVVTTQAQFTPAASQADRRTTVEGQALRASANGVRVVPETAGCWSWWRRLAVVVVQAGFQPEGGRHAATQVFRATEAQTRAVVAGVGQLGLVGHRRPCRRPGSRQRCRTA